MFARHGEALRHFFIGGQPDGDAAAVIAVIRLGHHGKPDALRGAHRLPFALHQFLFGHRQPERRQNLVGFLLVAGQLHRDVRRAAGHRRLDALLELAMTQLHQRLIIEPQPGDAVPLGGAHQRGGRGSQRAALREADELIARLLPTPVIRAPSRPAGWPRAAANTAIGARARRRRCPRRAAHTRRPRYRRRARRRSGSCRR